MLQSLLAHIILLYSIVEDTFYAMLTATVEKAKEVNNKPIMSNLIKYWPVNFVIFAYKVLHPTGYHNCF